MLGMYCNTCGGSMLGDGVTAVIHCERLSTLDFTIAPDSAPIHCIPDANPDCCNACGNYLVPNTVCRCEGTGNG